MGCIGERSRLAGRPFSRQPNERTGGQTATMQFILYVVRPT